jgi:hypothetical protein
MTTGAIIFAQNNSTVDYIKLAVFATDRIIKHLNIPVSLITDNKQWLLDHYPTHPFDQIIEIPVDVAPQQKYFNDGSLSSHKLEWKNKSRSSVYDLTPYSRTLVLDSDYIISSAILAQALDNDHDFQIYRNSFDLASWRTTNEFKRINQYSIPFYWATVFIFNKNSITQCFFDLITYIRHNWMYFRNLYSIDSSVFRNDFAFSIAIHIMNGKSNGEFAVELPGTMSYSTDKDILVDIVDNTIHVLLEKHNHPGEYILSKTQDIDLHVMNKLSLSRFIDGGAGV